MNKLFDNYEDRENCVVCNKEIQNILYTTPLFPVFQGVLDSIGNKTYLRKQVWLECPSCGTIQLKRLMPLSIIYQNGHAESFGNLWDSHHHEFSKFINKNTKSLIIEFGGGVGKLFEKFYAINKKNKWINYEANPIKKTLNNSNYKVKKKFLEESIKLPPERKCIVLSHVFEHLYRPKNILFILNKKLNFGDDIIISIPNQIRWLKENMPGAINWEHTFVASPSNIIKLFRNEGFELLDKKSFKTHSIFLHFRKARFLSSTNFSKINISDHVIRYFLKFSRVNLLIKKMVNNNLETYLMPASIWTQYLLVFGLKKDIRIKGILDNSTNKVGKFLYGYKYKILKPEKLDVNKRYNFVLNAGMHNQEIKKQLEVIFQKSNIIDVSLL